MSLTIFLAVLAFIAVGWYIVAGLMIFTELEKRGEKVYFIFLNFMLPFYAQRYKKITIEETGRTGRLFYHWLIAINTALVLGAAAIASKFWL
jgi:hypothetical protein